jgi:UDP-N-acetyl-2-amino-2-deoxyglucuronate dehydrogenase
MCSTAAHGERTGGVWVYGNKGCFRPGQYAALEDKTIIPMSDIIERYAPDVARNPFAHAYVELWEAIADRKEPISSAERGLEALGVVYAALESATIGQPVRVQDIIQGKMHAYEDTVIEEMKEMK